MRAKATSIGLLTHAIAVLPTGLNWLSGGSHQPFLAAASQRFSHRIPD